MLASKVDIVSYRFNFNVVFLLGDLKGDFDAATDAYNLESKIYYFSSAILSLAKFSKSPFLILADYFFIFMSSVL